MRKKREYDEYTSDHTTNYGMNTLTKKYSVNMQPASFTCHQAAGV